MEQTPTVHVVDDDEAVRDSLRFLLETEGMAVRTYAEAMALLDADLPPLGCVVTDFLMPGINGLQLQGRLVERGIRLPLIVMTGHADVTSAVRAMKAGAVDFLEKPFNDHALVDTVKGALERNRVELAGATRTAAAVQDLALLTPREREVFDQLLTGSSNKQIAQTLGTSPRTIDVHRSRVFHKLRVHTLPDLVRLAIAARPVPIQR